LTLLDDATVADEQDDFNVPDTEAIAQAMTGTTQLLSALLGAVATVGLLVGGIESLNIMLVSITERTGGIGTWLAIGALEREVLLQFLVEAMALSALGGVIGILLATGTSISLALLMKVPFVFGAQISVLVFGFFSRDRRPVRIRACAAAGRLDPIEALRHDEAGKRM
jgi:putative ABC transport system permease protein